MLTLSSTSENPRPARTRRLYLMDGQRTIGLSLSTGRGAKAAALERRALRRRDLRPGYVFNISMPPQYLSRLRACGCRWRWVEVGGLVLEVVGLSYLVEVGADTTLPILAEICGISVCFLLFWEARGWAYGCAVSVDCA